jgi:hypothetical protein
MFTKSLEVDSVGEYKKSLSSKRKLKPSISFTNLVKYPKNEYSNAAIK